MNKFSKYILVILLAAVAAVGVFKLSDKTSEQIATQPISSGEVSGASIPETKPAPKLSMPIPDGFTRMTKKPYGLYVTPATSPVPNDIFTGYHTGIDFETTPAEQNTDVQISAACDGKVLVKEWAKGYGGVLVQSCEIDGQAVTVLYGHLKLESITPVIGQTLHAGDSIGVLGQGGSHETDGRRKHLHFDIHAGTNIDILGYAATKTDLANWIDPLPYLQ